MILKVSIDVKELFLKARQYLWRRPYVCPRCGGRIWGHGFVSRYFDGCCRSLPLRRYRCSDCRCVIQMRPAGYFNRTQASVEEIRRVLAYWGDEWRRRLMDAFDFFVMSGDNPVIRSI